MNIFIIVQQMLILFAMMVVGYAAYRLSWLDDNACGKLSKVIVNILNPCMMINGVLGKEASLEKSMLLQTVLLAAVYFGVLILLSGPVTFLLRVKKEHRNLYRLMLIFSNVGFMGIPVVSGIYGMESVILIAFYNLGYNLLLYTYGVRLASDHGSEVTEKKSGQWKKLINPGVIACAAAIAIFVSGAAMPDSVCTFFNYMGNAVVPFSMIIIGTSFAQNGRKEFFTDARMYLFTAIKMLLIPVAAALLLQAVSWPGIVEGVFVLMLAMPVGSIVVLLAKECGADEVECTKGIVLTTLMSVVTIPVVSLFLSF